MHSPPFTRQIFTSHHEPCQRMLKVEASLFRSEANMSKSNEALYGRGKAWLEGGKHVFGEKFSC
jgi:hypothetical protein